MKSDACYDMKPDTRTDQDERQKQQDKDAVIQKAAFISLVGNTALTVLKIGVGVWAASGALIGDGIDSSVDILISIITLAVVRVTSRPADVGHPWGHGRAETVATVILSFLIFFAGAQLIFSSIGTLIRGEIPPVPSALALGAAGVSIIGKILLALTQFRMGKRVNSSILIANGKNMAGDVLLSTGVLVGVGVSRATGLGIADTIVTLLVGAWVIKSALGIFLEANLELMDGGVSSASYKAVFDAVKAVKGATNPHRARMRRITRFWDIDLDIEVDPRLTVVEAHRIASAVETEIKRRLDNVFDVMIHIEPLGGNEGSEGYGLSEGDVQGL